MGTQLTRGFTILETILFLAITGLMVVTMIAITGASINIQRYTDAAETFKSQLQDQYSDVTSVQNSRDSTWSCDATARPVESGNEQRGQSGCMLVGRYVRIEGSDITLYNVLARQTSQSQTGNDVERMKNSFIFNVDTTAIENKTMEWGTSLAWPSAGTGSQSPTTPRSLGILILRSPLSGQIYTFTSSTVATPKDTTGPTTLGDMIVTTAQTEQDAMY